MGEGASESIRPARMCESRRNKGNQLSTPPPFLRHTNAISHGLYDESAQLLGVTCTFPTENTLGTTVNWRARARQQY